MVLALVLGASGRRNSVCKLKKVEGNCRAAMSRYFFDAKASECKKFIYGGCGGNGNNFRTRHECERICRAALQS